MTETQIQMRLWNPEAYSEEQVKEAAWRDELNLVVFMGSGVESRRVSNGHTRRHAGFCDGADAEMYPARDNRSAAGVAPCLPLKATQQEKG